MSSGSREWKLPPKIKILEAASALASGRVALTENGAKVVSSRGTKEYTVIFRPPNRISSDDNGSVYRGYLGYPAVAFLMAKGILPYDPKIGEALKDVPWNELVKRFGRYDDVIKYVFEERGIDAKEAEHFIKTVLNEIKKRKFSRLEEIQTKLW